MSIPNLPSVYAQPGPNPYGNIATTRERDESMAVRAFSGWTVGTESPEDNWGLEQGPPPWLLDVHNRSSGRCFLMGTGPSLASQVELLPKLASEYVFTCNRLRLWDFMPFRPFVHCVTEPQPWLEWGRTIVPLYDFPGAQNKVAVTWFPVAAEGWLWCPKAPEEIQMRWQGLYGFQEEFRPIPTGWASPLTIASLAAWMGFREFIFMGIDTTNKGQAWDVEQGRVVYARNIRSILECFERARIDIEMAGGKVYDCTPGGRINQEGILPYVPLEEVLR